MQNMRATFSPCLTVSVFIEDGNTCVLARFILYHCVCVCVYVVDTSFKRFSAFKIQQVCLK